MAKVGVQRAAELTGKSKSTIQRSMNTGKISFEKDNNGRRVIDVSELERVFGIQEQNAMQHNSMTHELEKAKQLLESERMKMQIRALEDKLHAAEEQIEDLKGQRDKWQKQADQVLITSQFSQKQAEDLQEQIKDRERKAQERRQRKMDEHMQRLNANNQNSNRPTERVLQTDKNMADKNMAGSAVEKLQGYIKKVSGRAD